MPADILWTPPLDGSSQLEKYTESLASKHGLTFEKYEDLWTWTVAHSGEFWTTVVEHFEVPHGGDLQPALAKASMPGAKWFPNATINYAKAMLRIPGRRDDEIVITARSNTRAEVTLTVGQLREQVRRARAGLTNLGVGRGDRVVAYSPNIPETLVLLLASASLGAVFSSCAPEFGTQSVIDRWQQIEPTVLLAVDGYRFGAKDIDRRDQVSQIRAALPSLRATVWLPYLDPEAPAPDGATTWEEFLATDAPMEFAPLPFDAPLYVLFSSGTTGLPKPIVHGHGGITLEHAKSLALQMDLGPDDVFFWFSTTGWMMWNLLISGLLVGSHIVLYDGDPAYPNLDALWQMSGELSVTAFGTSAPFLLQCRKSNVHPAQAGDLSALRLLGSTGAPLPAEGFRWVYEEFDPRVQLSSVSGGTDVCSAFVGSAPTVPVYAGEISCRALGAFVDSVGPDAEPVRGQLGELVIRAPMPSMPVGFWGDTDGSKYRAAYFEDIPGMWRHGDWIEISDYGSCTITGRSDATLNRGGVRLGTSEFYAVVEALPEVMDSLVVHLEDNEGGAGQLVLFVALAEGLVLDEDLVRAIKTALRTHLSPRHIPDEIHQVRAMPRTLSGKKLEVPVKKILRGVAVEEAATKGALQNPDVLDDFIPFRP